MSKDLKIMIIAFSLRPESQRKMFPVGIGYIATAIKRAGFDFDLFDMEANRDLTLEDLRRTLVDSKYDVVCIGSLVSGYKRVKEICWLVKECVPNSTIIVGNSVATSIPMLLLQNTKADVAVMFEGDHTIIDLLNSIKNGQSLEGVDGIYLKKGGKIIKTKDRELIPDISVLPVIDFELFDVEKYIKSGEHTVNDSSMISGEVRALPISTARGCINNCTFCYHVFKGKKYRYRSAKSITDDAERILNKYNLNYIQFWDEITFFAKNQANELAQTIIDRGLKFFWMGRCRANLFDEESDLEIIEKLKRAGCSGVQFSLESSDPVILKEMKKNITAEQFSKQVGLFQKAGITAWTSLVFGYPQETPETIRNTIDCCIQNNIYPSAGFLLPQPGSQIYDYAVKNGFIKDEEGYIIAMGDRQDLTINMTKMSDQEFKDAVNKEMARCNEELGVGLDKDRLIKTSKFITVKK